MLEDLEVLDGHTVILTFVIMELDRGQLYDWTCDYQTFLKRRQLALDVEQKAQQAADQKLSQEEVWIRQGIKARRTRNEGRVRALQKMREEHRQRRQRVGQLKMAAAQTNRSGQLVIDAEKVVQSGPPSELNLRFAL